MMQNVAWKAMNSRCGIVVPSRGSNATPFSPTWSNPPMIALPGANAIE